MESRRLDYDKPAPEDLMESLTTENEIRYRPSNGRAIAATVLSLQPDGNDRDADMFTIKTHPKTGTSRYIAATRKELVSFYVWRNLPIPEVLEK